MCDKSSCDKLTEFYIAEDYVNNCYDKNIPIDFDVVTYHKSNGTFTKEPSFGFLIWNNIWALILKIKDVRFFLQKKLFFIWNIFFSINKKQKFIDLIEEMKTQWFKS